LRRAFALPGARSKRAKRRKKKLLSDEKVRELGRKHFARDFPHPERIGCPPKSELKQLAENPRQAKESVLGHISSCSPCYRDYGSFLQARKKKLRSKSGKNG
jgi:hypothetical protein